MTTALLIDDVRRDEGLRLGAYRDSRGVWTIGYGHTPAVEGAVWTVEAAAIQLEADVDTVLARLDRELSWWRALDDVRQDALANMAFNLGVGGLLAFHHMLDALHAGDWHTASAQMLLSDWAREVGDRAERLAFMIRTGTRGSFRNAGVSPATLVAAPRPTQEAGETPTLLQGPPPMTDTAAPTPIQTATLDMARSALMAAGAIPLAHGLATASQWQAIVGGLIAVGSAVWSYLAAHPSQTSALTSLLGMVRKGGQGPAWNGDVAALEAAVLPLVEKAVDAQIKARAGVLSGPVDLAANAVIKDAAGQVVSHLRI
jgi:lysozyme